MDSAATAISESGEASGGAMADSVFGGTGGATATALALECGGGMAVLQNGLIQSIQRTSCFFDKVPNSVNHTYLP